MTTSLPIITEDNIDEFMDAAFGSAGQEIFSVDLMAANPDVGLEVSSGGFDVSIHKLVFEGVEVFAALADDGSVVETADPADWVKLAETEPEARALANAFIMDWKRAWGLTL